ncbi:MAG: hypothetical protein R2697_06525 [Ilumatobacteraceae bacterium]
MVPAHGFVSLRSRPRWRSCGAHGSRQRHRLSAGGTGTFDLHGDTGVNEVRRQLRTDGHPLRPTGPLPFEQALFVVGTVISVSDGWAVTDVGLKALGMDHGSPSIRDGEVWFCSDEHTTFAPSRPLRVGDRAAVIPAHVDPTMAMHDAAWVVRGDEVLDRWPIDLRGW